MSFIDRSAEWTPSERLAALLALEIGDALAEELITAHTDDVLRRLDRDAVLREAAAAIQAVINADKARSPRRSNDRAALGGARQIVLGLIGTPAVRQDGAQG